jgi:hypothetical protein
MAMGPSPLVFWEEATLWIDPPPPHSNAPPPDELEQMAAIARKYDVAARDARNRALGRVGEKLISRAMNWPLPRSDVVIGGWGAVLEFCAGAEGIRPASATGGAMYH